MPGRIRESKTRSQRIELDYFNRPGPIARWRRSATYILAGAGLLLVGWYALGNQKIYSAGTLATAHQVVSGNCSACHVTDKFFSRKVTNPGCKSCHDGPPHHVLAKDEKEPLCASCHLDHLGAIKLARVSDASCTQCHNHLERHSRQNNFATWVTRFDTDHPNFERHSHKDPGYIIFDHKAHLERGIPRLADGPGADGVFKAIVRMECVDCHRPAFISQAEPYAPAATPASSSTDEPPRDCLPNQALNPPAATPASSSTEQPPRNRLSNQALMPPVAYEKHCQECHPLQFDELVTCLVPHPKKPEEVHEIVYKAFKKYADEHPGALPPLTQRERQLPGHPLPLPPRNATEWIKQRVDNAEDWLWRKEKKGCAECHKLKPVAGSQIREIDVEHRVPTRWFPNAVFDHQPHQMVTCITCHIGARTSERPAVLMPRIETCRECHSANSAQPAQTGCFECHVYHDWTKEKPVKGRYALHGPRRAARLVTATEH